MKKINFNILFLLSIIFFIIPSLFFFNENHLNKSPLVGQKVSIPEYYQNLFSFFDKENIKGRVLLLPVLNYGNNFYWKETSSILQYPEFWSLYELNLISPYIHDNRFKHPINYFEDGSFINKNFLDQNNVEYIVLHRDVDTLNKRVSKFLTHEYFEKYLSHSNFLKVYDSIPFDDYFDYNSDIGNYYTQNKKDIIKSNKDKPLISVYKYSLFNEKADNINLQSYDEIITISSNSAGLNFSDVKENQLVLSTLQLNNLKNFTKKNISQLKKSKFSYTYNSNKEIKIKFDTSLSETIIKFSSFFQRNKYSFSSNLIENSILEENIFAFNCDINSTCVYFNLEEISNYVLPLNIFEINIEFNDRGNLKKYQKYSILSVIFLLFIPLIFRKYS